MDLGLRERRALVLASSSGLGAAVAAGLTTEGVDVAITSRSAERVASASERTGAAVGLVGDLTEPGTPERFVTEAHAALGGLDILVVNTGGGSPGGILDNSAVDDRRAYESMLAPALEASRAAAPLLRRSDQARLVFLTARSVAEASTDLALSSVFRSGVAAAARSLALALAPEVLVNVIVTGQFDTAALGRFEAARAERESRSSEKVRADHIAKIPLGRVGNAIELADVVVFICSARASFVTGTAIRVDGGAIKAF